MPRREGNRLLLDGELTVDTVARVLADRPPQDRAAVEVVDFARRHRGRLGRGRARDRVAARGARGRTHDPVREPPARDGEARPPLRRRRPHPRRLGRRRPLRRPPRHGRCHRGPRARQALRRPAGARRRRPRDPARRVLRPARAERRRQDHAHQHPRRARARGLGRRARAGARRRRRLPRRAAAARRRAAGARLRSVLHRARDARDPVGLLRPARERRLDRRGDAAPRPRVEGRRQHAHALRRHEAPGAGRAGAGAPAAGDRARRADRRRRRRAAPGAVGVHPAAQPRRPHGRAHHPLHRGSGDAVRPHRDAEGRTDRRARRDADLIRRFHALYLRVRLEGAVPERLARARGRRARPGGTRSSSASTPRSKRRSPSCARRACRILEMELVQPDLEEVFVQIMRGAGTPDAERRAHH